MYGLDGSLSYYPVEDEHVRNLRTKLQRGSMAKLVNAANMIASEESREAPEKGNKSKPIESPKELLYAYVQDVVMGAGGSCNGKMSLRSTRRLKPLITCCVDIAAKELLHSSLEKHAMEKECFGPANSKAILVSPDKISSTATSVINPPSEVVLATGVPMDSTVDEASAVEVQSGDEDDESIGTTTTDEFLLELKECSSCCFTNGYMARKSEYLIWSTGMVGDCCLCFLLIQHLLQHLKRRQTKPTG
jgi:hypothetical protein